MSKVLGSDFSRTLTEKRLNHHLDGHEQAQRADAITQRKIVGDLHTVFLSRFRNDEDGPKLLKACAKAGIKSTARTSIALLFVRYQLRDRPAKPELMSRWTSVIRQALLDGIKPGELTAHLGTRGHSIKAMAARFTQNNRPDKGTAPRRSQLAMRCDEDLHQKLDRYCLDRPCWAQIEREKPGRFAIVKVSRRGRRSKDSSSTR